MIFIEHSPSDDPAVNFALEQHCLKSLDPSQAYGLTYVNRPSAIIGRHQNAFDQVNIGFLEERNIPVVRRMSGGGAVYHDYGNLNFAFITQYDRSLFLNYPRILTPVIDVLRNLGIPAEFSAPNGIVVESKKVSGNSQSSDLKRMLSHGTLLFRTDLNTLRTALTPDLEIVFSRGVRSVPRPVVNLSEALGNTVDFTDFRAKFTRRLSERFGRQRHLQLAPSDWETIHRLAREKYGTWEWNYGRSPDFTAGCQMEHGRVHIDVVRGLVRNVRRADGGVSAGALSNLRERMAGRRFSGVRLDEKMS